MGILNESERLAQSAGDEEAVAMARFNLAQAAEWTGDYRHAVTLSEQVVTTGRLLLRSAVTRGARGLPG